MPDDAVAVRPRNDWRARAHPSWWAFAVHRVSGVALSAFLPFHFWALSQALHGEAALDRFLRWTDMPLFKSAEWGLAILLTAHLAGGLRLLAIELLPWRGLRKSWIGWSAAASMLVGIAFAVALVASP